MKEMNGIWTALITPLHSDGRVDFEAYRKLIHRQIEAGVNGVIPCGTTGESPTLDIEEKKSLIQIALEETKNSDLGVIAGTGTNNTAASLVFSQWASDQGVDGVLLVTPYYNKPSQYGLEQHYTSIADSIDCEIMLYNCPGRTVCGLEPETIARLASHPKITALKETSGTTFVSETIEQCKKSKQRLNILSGDDVNFLPFLSIGASGLVSVASNLFPKPLIEIYKSFQTDHLSKAKELHQKFYPLFRDLFVESNPTPIKWAMSRIGIGTETVRPPLAPLSASKASLERLQFTLKKYEVIP